MVLGDPLDLWFSAGVQELVAMFSTGHLQHRILPKGEPLSTRKLRFRLSLHLTHFFFSQKPPFYIFRRRDTRKKKPPSYRVLLHNDDFNRREYVVQVLLKVAGITVEDALNVMQEAHFNGLALVTICSQEKAEEMCQGMRSSGLISTIEPSGPTGV